MSISQRAARCSRRSQKLSNCFDAANEEFDNSAAANSLEEEADSEEINNIDISGPSFVRDLSQLQNGHHYFLWIVGGGMRQRRSRLSPSEISGKDSQQLTANFSNDFNFEPRSVGFFQSENFRMQGNYRIQEEGVSSINMHLPTSMNFA